MNKEEFYELFKKDDDISAKRFSNIMVKYCEVTQDETDLHVMDQIDCLLEVQEYIDLLKEDGDVELEEPTLQDAIHILQNYLIMKCAETMEA